MKILTSLAEDTYFLGLSALINSLVARGRYVDKLVVGYRGDLPHWLPELKPSKNGLECILPCGIPLELVSMSGNLHMVHEKPYWFQYLTTVLEPDAEEYFFFDSDIVIVNRMSFFGEWIRNGIALCEDVNYYMPHNHPIRLQWARLAQENGLEVKNLLNRYYNSGFLGWTRQTAGFITEWTKAFDVLASISGDMKKFRVKDRSHPVLSANQDSLNLAAMCTAHPITTMGPEAMGFTHGLSLMAHPIGPKPWKRHFFKDSLKGMAPRLSDQLFWQNVNGTELQPLSASVVRKKQRACKFYRGVARVYHRN